MVGNVVLMISLAALLQQSTGQHPDFASLSTQNADQQNAITDKHNDLRRSVVPTASNMLKMVWEAAAAANAERWAQRCTISHSPQAERTITLGILRNSMVRTSYGRGCGENLFMSTAPMSWSEAIQAWYDEVKDFKYGYGSTTGAVVGHYTQVVWYRSWLIGCAVAYCPRARFHYYYVCHYCPAGNIRGKTSTPYKSGKPCADCPNACDNNLCTNPCHRDDDYSNCPDLVHTYGCSDPDVKIWCKASCQCTTEIK